MKKNVYFLLKLNRRVKNIHVKNLGIFLLHFFKKRYLGVFLDPVLGCNLRCRMCYFSDEEKRKTMKGSFTENDIAKIASAFFHRALKVQIGCGAEPSLFQYNQKIIELAKENKVPYVSMTTNANLFTETDWWNFAKAGLDELTLSIHGTTKESYEYFMVNASFSVFTKALNTLTLVKERYPDLKIRLNYTVNKDNLEELATFFTVFGEYKFDILQLRPIQPIGNSDYDNFSWNEIYSSYDRIIQKVKQECIQRGITCIAPDKEDLIKDENTDSAVFESTYCYISPKYVGANGFDLQKDTYETYSKRTHLTKKLFKNIFYSKKHFQTNKRQLNYDIS